MRWNTRHVVFTLCLALVTSAGYILAQKKSSPAPPVEEIATNQTNAQIDAEQLENAPGQTIKFGPIGPMGGYASAKSITLRESADASAPVVARLKVSDYERVEILGATRDFVRIRLAANGYAVDGVSQREHDYEGWTTWGSVVPDLSAIVLDAQSGAVVSRVPLTDGISSVTFSADGSRALFFHDRNAIGNEAYEVRTSDYTLTRSLTSSGAEYLGTLFYGAADGELYATVHSSEGVASDKGKVSLIRIGEGGAQNISSKLNLVESNFAISPDGLTGLIPRPESDNPNELTIDVIELATLTVRNTFTLTGGDSAPNSSNFVLNRDGSELYIKLSENTGAISVIDTRTGQRVRELPDSATNESSYFSQEGLVGDSLLLRVWEGGEDEMHDSPHLYWVGSNGRVEAESGISSVIEAGGKRYAINEEGTRLFKLNASNRIQERLWIARPELRDGASARGDLSVLSMSASPDGKHLIIFIGTVHGC